MTEAQLNIIMSAIGGGVPPLATRNHLQRLGAFKVPTTQIGNNRFGYGGTAPAYNPTTNTMFLVGHDWYQAIAEISVPDNPSMSTVITDLPRASLIQPFTDIRPRIPDFILTQGSNPDKIGGLMVDGANLIGTWYDYYDASYIGRDSHFMMRGFDLASSPIDGLFAMGVGESSGFGGKIGGYMCPIPPAFQALLGNKKFISGQSGLAIVSRTSSGPAAYGFNPEDFQSLDIEVPIETYVTYPLEHPLGEWGTTNPLYNGTTRITGAVFIPGTRSVWFFGCHGLGDFCYGTGSDCNDPCYLQNKGSHSVGGIYAYQIWAYDVLDFIKSMNGEIQPWEVLPYDVWNFDLPFSINCTHTIGGVSVDVTTNKIYVSQYGGEKPGYEPYPVIHIFGISA